MFKIGKQPRFSHFFGKEVWNVEKLMEQVPIFSFFPSVVGTSAEYLVRVDKLMALYSLMMG